MAETNPAERLKPVDMAAAPMPHPDQEGIDVFAQVTQKPADEPVGEVNVPQPFQNWPAEPSPIGELGPTPELHRSTREERRQGAIDAWHEHAADRQQQLRDRLRDRGMHSQASRTDRPGQSLQSVGAVDQGGQSTAQGEQRPQKFAGKPRPFGADVPIPDMPPPQQPAPGPGRNADAVNAFGQAQAAFNEQATGVLLMATQSIVNLTARLAVAERKLDALRNK